MQPGHCPKFTGLSRPFPGPGNYEVCTHVKRSSDNPLRLMLYMVWLGCSWLTQQYITVIGSCIPMCFDVCYRASSSMHQNTSSCNAYYIISYILTCAMKSNRLHAVDVNRLVYMYYSTFTLSWSVKKHEQLRHLMYNIATEPALINCAWKFACYTKIWIPQ